MIKESVRVLDIDAHNVWYRLRTPGGYAWSVPFSLPIDKFTAKYGSPIKETK